MTAPRIPPEAIVARARAWIGTPYVHQASRLGAGCDCLGLIRGLWRELRGAEACSIPPYSPDWGEAGGQELLANALRRFLMPVTEAGLGDVVLFRMLPTGPAKHLGLISAGAPAPRFIHAYSGHGVVETPLSAPWARRIAAQFRFPERIS